jgi:hypothetical protein
MTADHIPVDLDYLANARRKYRQLVREIEQGRGHTDLLHSAYKLGSFLDEAMRGAFSACEERAPDFPPTT